MPGVKTLFVGGVRSGKSKLAKHWLESMSRGGDCVLIATCRVCDAEMAARVARHQQERGENWRLLEEHLDPATALKSLADQGGFVMLDCISAWLANLLEEKLQPQEILDRADILAQTIARTNLSLAIVSAETGCGTVPLTALGRLFQDLLGETNQILARACDAVFFVSCGLALPLKGSIKIE